jgi:hypothetical protein
MLLLALAGPAPAKLPSTADEFRQRMAADAKQPEGAAKLWFEAVYVYTTDATRDAGRQMLGLITLDEKWEKNTYFVDRMRTKPYIFRSYAKGTSPDNGYRMDPNSFTLNVTASEKDKYRDDAWRVVIKSSGADKDRPLVLSKGADGLWRVFGYDQMYGDVTAPK